MTPEQRNLNLDKIRDELLLLFVFSLHFEYWDPLGVASFLTIPKLIGYGYFLTCLSSPRRFFKISYLRSSLLPLISFFAIITIVSFINSFNNSSGASFFQASILQCILLFWVISNHLHQNSFLAYRSLIAFLAGGVVISVLFALNLVIITDEGRLTIFGDNPNTVGIRLSISIIVLTSLVFENPLNWKEKRFWLILLVPLIGKAVFDTGSRTALAILAAGFLVIFFFTKIKRKYLTLFIVGLSALMAFLVLYYLRSDILIMRVSRFVETGDTAGRVDIWNQVLPMFYKSPVFGVGITGYEERILTIFGGPKNPHNVLIELLCYTGIVGTTAYFLFIFRIVERGIIAWRKNGILLPAIMMLMIFLVLMVGQGLYRKSFYYLYSVIVALGQINHANSAE